MSGVVIAQIEINDSSDRTITGVITYDRTNGGTFVVPAGTAFPGTPVAGEMFWRTDSNVLYRYDGSDWVSQESSSRLYELGENLSAGDPVEVYDDAGTPKVRKVFSILADKDNWPTAGADDNIFAAGVTVSANKVAVAYRDVSASANGLLVVGDIQPDNSIVWGTPVTFSAGTTSDISIVKLDTDKVCVCYRGSTNQGTARAATIVGTVPTFGTAATFSTGNAFYIDSEDINTDKFVVVYADSAASSQGTARVGSVAGTTITYGASSAFRPGAFTFATKVAKADTDKFVAFYRGTSNFGLARAATVTGTTIGAFGTEAAYNSALTTNQYACRVDTDKVAVAYQDNGNGNRGTLCVGTLVGTTITFGAEFAYTGDEICYYTSMEPLTTTELAVVYAQTSSYAGLGRRATITGTNVSFNDPQQYEALNVRYPNVSVVDSDTILLLWALSTNENWGLVVDALAISSLVRTAGILEVGGNLGDVRPVTLIGGTTGALSGMTAGEVQYIQDDSSISNVASPFQIGLALAADAMLITKSEDFR